jgi:RNA polymerase sigma-70 factor (ECF subfamily)
LRAHLLRKLRRADEARDAYERAIGLSEDPAVREFLVAEAGR